MHMQRALGRLRVLPQLTLLQRFTIVGVVVTLVLVILFGEILSNRMIEDALDESAREASVVVTTLVTAQVTARDFDDPSPATAASWEQRVGRVVGKFNVVRVKVWRPDGTIVYSDERGLIGRTFPLAGALQDALRGQLAREVTTLGKQENAAERPYGKLLEVYLPIIPPGSAKPVGAYEVYQSFAPLQARITNIRRTVWGGSFAVFSLLFVSLYALVRAASRQLHHMAYHDPLTGLANRRLLRERAEQALTLARRHGRIVGLLYLDLARFKAVNDTLGHSAGDELLKKVTHRLSRGLRETDTLTRLGGDEFAILLSEVQRKNDAAAVAQRVLQRLHPSFWLEGQPVHIDGNLGITLYPDDGTTFEELMKHADIAMYQAKADGVGVKFYHPELDVYSRDRLLLETELREALRRQKLVLFYQPIVDLRHGRMVGVEAVIRWPHPRRGLIQPEDFVPLAEESDLILHLDRWTLAAAIRQAQAWVSQGWHGWIAVNHSTRSLGNPELPEYVSRMLEKLGVPSGRLMFEVTERTAMRDPELTVRVLNHLNALGVLISIDDFGLGYSSLAYLKRFPVHQLKIDRSFVRGIGKDHRDERLVEAMITLTRALGVQVLAEGVESTEAVDWLTRRGCDLAQGFSIGRPVPPEELTKQMETPAQATRSGLG